MKLVTYRYNGRESVGVLTADEKNIMPVWPLGLPYNTMNELIEGLTDEQRDLLENGKIPGLPLEEVELLAPIPVPRQDILCLGINYMAHAEEGARYHNEAFGGERPFPIYFSKRVNEAVGHGGFIESHSDIEERLDYECELAVIIGKDAKNVKEGEEWDYIEEYLASKDLNLKATLDAKEAYTGADFVVIQAEGLNIAGVNCIGAVQKDFQTVEAGKTVFVVGW